MAINEDIWGASETWVNCLNSLCKTSEKTAYQLIDDTIEMNDPIDNSMCWCGIAQNLHKFYLAHSAITNNADFSPLKFQALYKITDVVNVPFLLSLGGSYFEYTFDFHNMWGRWADISSLSDGEMNLYITGQCKPIFNLQLNKLIFIPSVTAFEDNDPSTTDSQSFTLSDWIHTGHTTHPYLAQLFITPYSNHGSESNPNWLPCFDSYDHYEYFIPNLEASDYIQNLPDSNFKIRYDFTNVASRKLTTLLMGCQHPYIGTYGTHRVIIDDDISHYVSDSDHVRYCRQYSQELIDDIRTQIAFLGVFFVGDYISSLDDLSLTHESVYCGIIDEGGLTHGEFSHGEGNADRQQFDWEDTSESEYDPSNPPKVDPNNYTVGMHTNYPWITSPNKLYSIGSTNAAAINDLYNSLWECYYTNNVGTDPDMISPSEFNFDEFLTVSPIDTIISLKLFPYDTKSASTFMGIRLGKYNTGVNAHPALMFNILDFGKVNIFAYFGDAIEGDWRDRETRYTFYAPFCGTLDLDPAFYMGHDVHLEYWIDQVTGACTAALYIIDSNNVKVYGDTISGVCAVDIPITGVDQATIQAQIFNANQQLKNANINAASSLISSTLSIMGNAAAGNVAGAAGAAISGVANFAKANNAVESAEYNLHHNKMTPRIIGAASPLCSQLGDWIPRIIISVPKDSLNNSSRKKFAETKGFACIIPGRIGSRSGFVQAINVKIIPPADATTAPTEAEAEMIKSLMAGGIYI